MFDRMRKFAIGLSIIAMLLAAVALFYEGTVRIEGATGSWISGIGSLASATVALGIALWNDYKDRRDRCELRTESRERALRRAKRIEVNQLVSRSPGSTVTGVTLYVKNGGDSPLYEVKWYPPVVVLPAQSGRGRQVFCDTAAQTTYEGNIETNVLAASSRVVEPGRSYGVHTDVQTMTAGAGEHLKYHVYPVVAFEDDDGYRFGRTLVGTVGTQGQDDNLAGRWELVDVQWPWKCDGPLRDLFSEVTGWAPGTPDHEAAE